MAVLSYPDLVRRGSELIKPFDASAVQPASVDLHLDWRFYISRKPIPTFYREIDMWVDSLHTFVKRIVEKNDVLRILPNQFVLASTYESVNVPKDLVARFEGKSSLARLGLMSHVTAGFIDPGYCGRITLELKNVNEYPILLYPGMKIGQICFEELTQPVDKGYGDESFGSHYQNQPGPVLSRVHENFKLKDVYSW